MKISKNGTTGLALLAVGMMLLGMGCGREPGDDGAPADTLHVGDSLSAVDTARPNPDTSTAWHVSPSGVGPIRVGMSAPEAGTLLGVKTGAGDSDSCYFIRTKGDPDGVLFMITKGRIARVDVVDAAIPTTEGARVGDSEERIMELYQGRVRRAPHKYTDGHYLVVTPDDATRRIIFETDGGKVTRYRAGLLPEVEWVEGCS